MKLNRVHIFLLSITSFPVWWIGFTYIARFSVSDRETVASAITVSFLGFIYIGRYFANIWVSQHYAITDKVYLILAVLIGANVIWLFIYPDLRGDNLLATSLLSYWLALFIVGIAIGMFIKFIRIHQEQLLQANLNTAHSESERQLLQWQLSPHFLFNMLNNLYGLSITKHEKVPPLLLKLSELLRYSVYEARDAFIALKEEVNYINNYIDFEKIRLGDRLVLNASIQQDSALKVAPMMLIIFIENAFKHSKDSTDQHIQVDIKLKTSNDLILFSISNSYQYNAEKSSTEKNSGFGLDNIKKRLQLLYPGRHDLKIEVTDDLYTVNLSIKTT